MRRRPKPGPESHRALQTWVEERWRSILIVLAITVVLGTTIVRFVQQPFYISEDSALFQHGGWYISQGATLYVDIWDLKPPLIYVVTTGLAVLVRGDMAWLHVLSVLVSVAAVVGGIIYTGRTVYRLTDDGFASVVSALSLFTLTSLYSFPWAGVRPKYFAFLCGAAALFYVTDHRYLIAGVAAALGTGFWQLGAGVAALVVVVALQHGGRRAALRAVAGGVAVTAVTVAPFVATGTVIPLFVEVVVAPTYGVEQYTVPARLLQVVVEVGYGVVLVPAAAYGWWRGIRVDRRTYWWVGAGGVTYLSQLFLEFQGAIELVLVFLFLALGIGILVAETPSPSLRSAIAVSVVLLIVSAAAWQAGPVTPGEEQITALQAAYDVPDYAYLPADPPGVPSMGEIYWEQHTPDACHYRLGHKQKYFAAVTDSSLTKSTCGQWPFEAEPVPWLAERLWPFA